MSLSTPERVQKLQTALHDKAKEAPNFRFYALYDKVYRKDVLSFAYECCKANGGAAGVDGQTFEDTEAYGRERWLDELAQERKFCTPNGGTCTSKTIGLLVRRHIVAGEFHYVGKEASTRWTGGPDLSMMAEAGLLDPMDETFREYERVVDEKYLEEIREQSKEFSTKRLSRKSGLAECATRNFKNGKNTIRPRSLRKLTRAIHDLQNRPS